MRDTITSQLQVHDPCSQPDPLLEVVIDENLKDESRLPSVDITSLAKQGYIEIGSKLLSNVKNDLILFKGIDKETNRKSPPVCPNCKLKIPNFARTNRSCQIMDSDECNPLPMPSYNCQIGYCSNRVGLSCTNVTNGVDPSLLPGTGNYKMPEVYCCCSKLIDGSGPRTIQKVILNYPTDVPLA